jgi:hypothetical protein|tara:strand:+ start:776 stop:1030 length:255 start_codon:yes stop_codon:yes gene_type:complete
MLSKQSIRGKVEIYHEGEKLTKDDIIELSKEWSEIQENFFRKMLKQGGKFSIKGYKFSIIPEEQILNGKGEKDSGIITLPDIKF